MLMRAGRYYTLQAIPLQKRKMRVRIEDENNKDEEKEKKTKQNWFPHAEYKHLNPRNSRNPRNRPRRLALSTSSPLRSRDKQLVTHCVACIEDLSAYRHASSASPSPRNTKMPRWRARLAGVAAATTGRGSVGGSGVVASASASATGCVAQTCLFPQRPVENG